MYVRIHMVKSFGIDDAFMIAALVSTASFHRAGTVAPSLQVS